jgi:energy-coupling factor transporter ATP-binding protein EcfA2
VLDEPTTGLHPSDVAKLMKQLDGLVESGNMVVAVEHDMAVAAASDWIIDIGPGARDATLKKARQAEATAHMDEWLNSPGLHLPKKDSGPQLAVRPPHLASSFIDAIGLELTVA